MRSGIRISKAVMMTAGFGHGADQLCRIGSERHGGLFVVPEWKNCRFVCFFFCLEGDEVVRMVVLVLFLDGQY